MLVVLYLGAARAVLRAPCQRERGPAGHVRRESSSVGGLGPALPQANPSVAAPGTRTARPGWRCHEPLLLPSLGWYWCVSGPPSATRATRDRPPCSLGSQRTLAGTSADVLVGVQQRPGEPLAGRLQTLTAEQNSPRQPRPAPGSARLGRRRVLVRTSGARLAATSASSRGGRSSAEVNCAVHGRQAHSAWADSRTHADLFDPLPRGPARPGQPC